MQHDAEDERVVRLATDEEGKRPLKGEREETVELRSAEQSDLTARERANATSQSGRD